MELLKKIWEVIREVLKSLWKQLTSRLLISLIMGAVAFVVFKLFKINYPFIIASIVAVTNIVPTVGPIVGALICSILVAFQAPAYILHVVVFFVIIQLLDTFVLTPKIMGKALDLNPLLVFGAVLIGGIAFGAVGALLAAPALVAAKSVIRAVKGKASQNEAK